MNTYLQNLFMFEKFEVQTKFSKDEIQRRISTFVEFGEDGTYYGSLSDDGFSVAKKSYINSGWRNTRNSFAPIVKGKIVENNGITTVSVTMRMHILVHMLYMWFMLGIVLIPVVVGIGYIGFLRPAKKLRAALEELMMEKER